MVYSFARVSAVVGMRVEDYYQQGKRWWLRLQEKGGKHHAVPVHHKAEAYLDAYLAAAGIAAEKNSPLWRSMPRAGGMGARRMSRVDVFRMIKRRVKTVGLGEANCHTFRATVITAYLLNGGTLERAQAIAAHESPRTTNALDLAPTVYASHARCRSGTEARQRDLGMDWMERLVPVVIAAIVGWVLGVTRDREK